MQLDPRTTALVLIDLQKGIVGSPMQPRSGTEVVERSRAVATEFRQAGATVILVHVGFAPDFADAPRQTVDQPMTARAGGFPPGWTDLVDGLAEDGDVKILKRQWGAFYGTDLDLQLRRRGITTIVLGGISTNFGVESTARAAWEHGYGLVIAEDLCASASAEMHDMAIKSIFPRLSRVVQSADLTLEPA